MVWSCRFAATKGGQCDTLLDDNDDVDDVDDVDCIVVLHCFYKGSNHE